MSIPVITENCYTCRNCLVIKQLCRLKNKPILHIYRDKCDKYIQRDMMRCKLCGAYIIELPQHVSSFHKKTIAEYNIMTKHIHNSQEKVRGNNLWD